MGNAVAAINPERPKHHEHASEAAVPGEGLLHMRNLPPSREEVQSKSQICQNNSNSNEESAYGVHATQKIRNAQRDE